MADKELTVILLDDQAPRSTYKYVFDVLASKLLKGLKTDYVTVATYRSAETEHASAHTGKFKGINVLISFETVSYKNLRRLRETVNGERSSVVTPHVEIADVVQTVLFASTLFAPTKNKVYKRNIVLVARGDTVTSDSSIEHINAIPKFFADYSVNFNLIYDGGVSLSEESVLLRLTNVFPESRVMSADDSRNLCELHPAVRKTRPMAAYMGDLRLGSDFSRAIADKRYDSDEDEKCISFRVEVYVAAKSDVSSSEVHEYVVEADGSIVSIDQKTDHFVWEKNFQGVRDAEKGPGATSSTAEKQEKEYDKVGVESQPQTAAFKFSNFDLIAVGEDLQKAATFPLFSAFDILGFISREKLPFEYLTGEAHYVVPDKGSAIRNTLNFQAFVSAMHTKGMLALGRFVRKQEKEVEVGVLFPVRIKSNLGHTSTLVFIRLPYREDEKVGKFPPLKEESFKAFENRTSGEAQITTSAARLMDEFVCGQTYESGDESKQDIITGEENAEIDNYKVTMKSSESSKLALPPRGEKSDAFLCSSPSANRYQAYMRKTLMKSLSITDWTEYIENPKFIAEVLRDSADATNFFNMKNCLAVNSRKPFSSWSVLQSDESRRLSKRLCNHLGSEYVRKSETKKAKVTKNSHNVFQKGNYGADEGTYDEVPDFGI